MITPIIMESDIVVVEKKIKDLRVRGEESVHIDIGDGLFSELLTIAPADLQGHGLENFMFDLHLLVDDPTEYIEECVALAPRLIIGQIERMGSQMRYLETIVGYGYAGGLGLAKETPIEAIEKEALKAASAILLLAVPAGTSGSKFDQKILDKIADLRKIYQGKIIIDGGITNNNYDLVRERGADEACANSWFWNTKMHINV